MRYIVSESQGQIHTAVWGKSQFRDHKRRECSHRDYLRNNGIAFEDVLAVGWSQADDRGCKRGFIRSGHRVF